MPSKGIVHIIDDDDAVRDSLGFLLETSGFVVKTYASGKAFLKSRPEAAEGCVITDVRMPGMSGIELTTRLKAEGSRLPIIVITGHGDVPLAVQAMKAGASDFIEKPFDDDSILRALETALGRSPSPAGPRAIIAQRLEALSARERQVLDALVLGRANKVIAQELGISPRTVEVYRANVMSKMQASSLSELVRMVILVDPLR